MIGTALKGKMIMGLVGATALGGLAVPAGNMVNNHIQDDANKINIEEKVTDTAKEENKNTEVKEVSQKTDNNKQEEKNAEQKKDNRQLDADDDGTKYPKPSADDDGTKYPKPSADDDGTKFAKQDNNENQSAENAPEKPSTDDDGTKYPIQKNE